MNEIEEFKKDLDLIIVKATEYDKLDHKFKLVCGKGVEQTLQHLCVVGFGDGSKVNHDPVEVPPCADKVIKEGISLGASKVEIVGNAESYSNTLPDDKFSKWFKENEDLFLMAVSNGYTMAKEPLYIISKSLETNKTLKNYFMGFIGGLEPLMDCRKKRSL